MAEYLTAFLFIAAVMGVKLSYGESSVTPSEGTPPGLGREVEDNSRYKTLNANATLLKLLVDDKDGVSRSEVFDMLHSRDDNQEHIDLPSFPEDTEDARVVLPAVPDSQAEFLQVDGGVRKDSQRVRYAGMRGEPVGTAAGIMVVITCSIDRLHRLHRSHRLEEDILEKKWLEARIIKKRRKHCRNTNRVVKRIMDWYKLIYLLFYSCWFPALYLLAFETWYQSICYEIKD